MTELDLTGPVPGPALLAGATADPPAGYVEEEYVLSGTAGSYRAVGELGADGLWNVGPAETAEFRTRLLVRRPADPDLHNGTVVVEWLNVSAGTDAGPEWSLTHRHLTREGAAWVGVSAQKVGVAGGAAGMGAALQVSDPQRYGSLVHPGDAWSFDMFTQAARVVRTQLAGLRPERVIAAGVSQSAAYLVGYLNAVAPAAHAFDAYLVHSRGGGVPPLSGLSIGPDGAVDFSGMTRGGARIRTDLTVPVLVLQTETDLVGLGYVQARQPDTPLLRVWELAGAAHADTYLLASGRHDEATTPEQLAQLCAPTHEPFGPLMTLELPINAGPQHHYVAQAAIAALDRWIRDGTPAPTAPPLALTSGEPPALVLDELGVATGGIRTGFVDVPASILSGLGQDAGGFGVLFGSTRAFDDATLRRLYPGGREEYAKRFADATARAVAEGFVLAADAGEINAVAVAMYPDAGS